MKLPVQDPVRIKSSDVVSDERHPIIATCQDNMKILA